MIRRRPGTAELERTIDRLTVERDTARQDVATLTDALRCALAANDELRRECAAVEERADRLGEALEWEHAAVRTLRREVEALDRWAHWSPAQILAVCSDAEHWRSHRCEPPPDPWGSWGDDAQTVTVPPSGLSSGEVSPGAAPCGLGPGVNGMDLLSSPADAPADGGTVTP